MNFALKSSSKDPALGKGSAHNASRTWTSGLDTSESINLGHSRHCRSEMLKEPTSRQANFGSGRSQFLLQILLEQAANGLRVENTFKKEAWNSIVKEFNKHYREDYSMQAIKNHYQSLRT
ncbi:hypothetical protein DFH28DRAFT_1120581 [Melampsora americana]|nr:hypothetical protein DFH28DRAFT_1120581 [Melampsora americana]